MPLGPSRERRTSIVEEVRESARLLFPVVHVPVDDVDVALLVLLANVLVDPLLFELPERSTLFISSG